MSDTWYYTSGGNEHGPVTRERLHEMGHAGALLPTDKVRRGTDGRWVSPSVSFFPNSVLASHPHASEAVISTISGVPYGIGGWLILPAIGLILSIIRTLISMMPGFNALGDSGIPEKVKQAAGMELGLLALYLVATAGAAICFFRKLPFAPMVMIGWLWCGVAATVIDGAILSSLAPFPIPETIGTAIAAGLWTLYFLRSKRVAATFNRGHREQALLAPERWWEIQRSLELAREETGAGVEARRAKLRQELETVEKLLGDETSMNLYKELKRRFDAGQTL